MMKRLEKVAVLTYGNGDREAYWTDGGEMSSFKLIWKAKADIRGYAMLVVMPRKDYLKDPYAGEPVYARSFSAARQKEVANAV